LENKVLDKETYFLFRSHLLSNILFISVHSVLPCEFVSILRPSSFPRNLLHITPHISPDIYE